MEMNDYSITILAAILCYFFSGLAITFYYKELDAIFLSYAIFTFGLGQIMTTLIHND